MTNELVSLAVPTNYVEDTMATPFGPQLIGETEKTLNALLRRHLEGSGLSEPQWVTLQLADAFDGKVDRDGLVATVADRAHFYNSDEIVRQLTEAGLLADGRLSDRGRALLTTLRGSIAATTGPLFRDLDAGDVDATTRVLNELVTRARGLLG
jgi:hypothetical protein